MAPERNASIQEQIMKKTQQEEDEIEMDDDAGAVVVVDTSSSRDGLLCALLRLQVMCGPLFVLRKKLLRSYLSRNQNYLAISQTEYEVGFRRHGVLTDEEHGRVRDERGLPLRALDRRGVSYGMVLIQLSKTCRLRTGWGQFLRGSGVRQDDDTHVGDVVEIWAFRSTATGLGLVLLHYTKEEEDAIITASLQHEDDEEEDGIITTSSNDSSSDSDQETQCIDEDDQDEDDRKNCSPLGQCQDDNCSSPLDKEVEDAAAILISMAK